MKRQREIMGKESYMREFKRKHELAFNGFHEKDTAAHGLHNDGGLPEQGHAAGVYSNGKLSYGEWHRLSCARLAYDE